MKVLRVPELSAHSVRTRDTCYDGVLPADDGAVTPRP